VVVHTDPNHFVRRNNIRTTYGSRELFLPIEIRVIFLLGRVKTLQLQNDILRENSQYGDIIQGDFIDAYHNLTSKVKYVVKTDDDAIFDMWRFLKLVHANNLYVSETIYGIINSKGIIFRGGKWAVDATFLKGQEYYPFKFCIGFVLVYSSDVIPALYRASYVEPFLWLDDVYVTGMLRTAANITKIIQNEGNLKLVPESKIGLPCLQLNGDKCPYLAVGVRESTYRQSWMLIKKRNQK
ncbi:beta-1,3-galactosyltransferase 1-like, partial [Patella vulgata]|uniref:beta-1,3-galactosyltransferase 1-like n=1 Tax=Patella vulgata TaxID=6465 RepID=UPI0024A9EB75